MEPEGEASNSDGALQATNLIQPNELQPWRLATATGTTQNMAEWVSRSETFRLKVQDEEKHRIDQIKGR